LFKNRNTYLRKLVLSYMALTIIIIGLFGGYFTKRTYDLLAEEISKESLYELERVKAFVEDNYLERYQTTVLDKAMTTIRESSMEEIYFFLDHPIEGNYYRVTRLVHDLKTLSITQPDLDNVTIVFNRSGIVADTNYYYADPKRSPNGSLIENINALEPHKWFVRDMVDSKGGSYQVLSYIYTLPYKSSGQQIKGYMIVDVNAAEMIKGIQKLMRYAEDQIYLFTESGTITSNAAGKGPVVDYGENIVPLMNKQVTTVPFSNSTMLSLLPANNSKLGWSYVSVRPIASYLLLTQTLKKEIWIVVICVLLIGLILSYLLSVRLDKPIQLLNFRVNQLNRHVREKHLQDLLNGTLPVQETQLPFPEKGLYVAVLLTPTDFGRRDELSKEFGLKNHRFIQQAVSWGKEQLAVVYQLDEADEMAMDEIGMDEIRSELAEFRLKIGEGLNFSAGIGSIVEDIEQIFVSFTEAKEAAAYRFLMGEESVILYEDMKDRSSVLIDLMPGELFENLIRGGTAEQIHKYFSDIRSSMETTSYSIQGIELYLNQVALCVAKITLEAPDDYYRSNPKELLDSYRKETLRATLSSLEELCLQLSARLQYRSETAHSVLADKLKSYIDGHLQEDLSLDDLAEVTAYSKQFICKVFKEHYSVTIADYLTKQRIERAKGLLADGQLSIADVAERSGYRSPGYFGTKFKQHTGVTPMQFRSMLHIDKGTINEGT
jgi:two-component system response regulator YesN